MLASLRERQVQAAARRVGLKLVVDCYDVPKGNGPRALLPAADRGRQTRRAGAAAWRLRTCTVEGRRRYVARPLLLDDVELLLSRWSEPAGTDQHHVQDSEATVPAHNDGPHTFRIPRRRTSPTAAYRNAARPASASQAGYTGIWLTWCINNTIEALTLFRLPAHGTAVLHDRERLAWSQGGLSFLAWLRRGLCRSPLPPWCQAKAFDVSAPRLGPGRQTDPRP